MAERAVALIAAHGAGKTTELAVGVFDLLGHGWRRGTETITAEDVERELYLLARQLAALDVIAASWPVWSAGPSARCLLPGIALADLL